MLATVQTCAVLGLDGYIVQVEVDISPGLPVFKKVATQNALQGSARSLCECGGESPAVIPL